MADDIDRYPTMIICPLCKGKGTAIGVDAIDFLTGEMTNPRQEICMVCDGHGSCIPDSDDESDQSMSSETTCSESTLQTEYEEKFKAALTEEFAAGWPYYDDVTRKRMGEDQARLHFQTILRAMRRVGLRLAEANDTSQNTEDSKNEK